MKKLKHISFWLLLATGLVVTVFTSCSEDNDKTEEVIDAIENNTAANDETINYVEINGVKWATCNVDKPGIFTSSPEDAGMLYQFNSNIGWPIEGSIDSITATDGSVWNQYWYGGYTSPDTTDVWLSEKDPSPSGFRVPTYAEGRTLLDQSKVTVEFVTENGIACKKFIDKTTGDFIILPTIKARKNSGYSFYPQSSYLPNAALYGYCASDFDSISGWSKIFYAYAGAVRSVVK